MSKRPRKNDRRIEVSPTEPTKPPKKILDSFNGAEAVILKEPAFPNFEEASAFLDEVGKDCVSYVTLVVRYAKGFSDPLGKHARLLKIYERTFARYRSYRDAHAIQKGKPLYVGCKKCGSHLARKFIESNDCPICGGDLRRKNVLIKLNGFEETLSDIRSAIDKEIISNSNSVMWLARSYGPRPRPHTEKNIAK